MYFQLNCASSSSHLCRADGQFYNRVIQYYYYWASIILTKEIKYVAGCHKTAGALEEMCRLRQQAVRNGCRSAVYTRKFSKRKQRNGKHSRFFSYARLIVVDLRRFWNSSEIVYLLTLYYYYVNRTQGTILDSKGNYSATSNYSKLVHWPLMVGLLHLVQRGGLRPRSVPSSLYQPTHQRLVYRSLYCCSAVLMWRLKG